MVLVFRPSAVCVLYVVCMCSVCVLYVVCMCSVCGLLWGHAVAQLVETLPYKPEGRGFDSRLCYCNFLVT